MSDPARAGPGSASGPPSQPPPPQPSWSLALAARPVGGAASGAECPGHARRRREPAQDTMRVFLPVLLAALLGAKPAHSLMCFSCTDQKSNFYCLKPTICSNSDNYCVTISAAAGIGNMVDFGHSLNKGCSPVCPAPPNINLGVASMGTYCCQSFLCNISAADGGLRASAAVLGAGLLISLLTALLRLGP